VSPSACSRPKSGCCAARRKKAGSRRLREISAAYSERQIV
jgi:hypothetical protein